MPQFVSDPNLRFLREESGERVDTSQLRAAQTLQQSAATAGAAIGGAVSKHRANTIAEKTEKAVGGAAQSLADLDNERNEALVFEQETAQRVAGITADGIQEGDQEMLDEIRTQVDQFSNRRKLLNPAEFNTRRNDARTQALAAAADQGHAIQRQIREMFDGRAAQSVAPRSAADAKLAAALDQQYGVGGWNSVEKGKYIGEQQYLQIMVAKGAESLNNLDGEIQNVGLNIAAGPVRALRTKLLQKGGLADVDVQGYQIDVGNQLDEAKQVLEQTIANARAEGQPLDKELVDRLRADYAVTRNYYTKQIFEQEFKDTDFITQFDNGIKIREKAFHLNLPIGAAATFDAATGGGGGAGGQQYALAIANKTEAEIAVLLPDSKIPPKELKRMAASNAFSFLTVPDFSYDQQVKHGLMHENIAMMLSSQYVAQVVPETTSEFDKWNKSFGDLRVKANTDNKSELIESIHSVGNKANKVKTTGDTFDIGKAKETSNQVLRAYTIRVKKELENAGNTITITPDGITIDRPISSGGVAMANERRTNSDNRELVNALYSAYKAYSDAGLADMSDLEDLHMVAADEVERLPGNANPLGRMSASRRQQETSTPTPTAKVFPTRHPLANRADGAAGSSNVVIAGVNIDGVEYNIPTMVDGVQLSLKEAQQVAIENGLENYPSFDSPEEASAWAEKNHGNINANGELMTAKPRSNTPTSRAIGDFSPEGQARIEEIKAAILAEGK
jgi:hypothetical protein